MLAVPRASMNQMSSLEAHYGDPEKPFGFVFGGDEPAPTPEARAPGKPLLNDFELNSNNQFFDQFSSDGALLEFESFDLFSHEPIPNFQGVSSSLPMLDTTPIHTLDFATIGTGDLTSRFGQAQLTSPTVAENHGFHDMSFTQSAFNSFASNVNKQNHTPGDVFSTQDLFPPAQRKQVEPRSSYGRSSAPTIRHDSMSSPNRPVPPSKHGSVQYDNGEALVNPDDPKMRRPNVSVGFGTDSNFQGHRYTAPDANMNDLKGSQRMMQSNVDMFNSKWEQTEPPPSARIKRRMTGEHDPSAQLGYIIRHSSDDSEELDSPSRKSKKRRESDESPSGDEGPGSAKKAKAKHSRSDSSVPTLSARRKSGLGDPKPARQNLTEEEKKQNHIRSEQKRRNQIKEGFDNLIAMMPENCAGASKCAILSQAVDWLSDLIDGNEQLRAQLASM